MKFEPQLKARANLSPGVLYAVNGNDGFIYYCQVAKGKNFGFFKYRTTELASPAEIIAQPIMSRFLVGYPSIGRALREGAWGLLGKHLLVTELETELCMVQWPSATLQVDVWQSGKIIKSTHAFDPDIQQIEVIQAYDAIHHVPNRLIADYNGVVDCLVGGSVLRMRLFKEHMASKFPDQKWHQLPENWQYVN